VKEKVTVNVKVNVKVMRVGEQGRLVDGDGREAERLVDGDGREVCRRW
jgi:predicted lipid-binding transport protein (Tim44 family)